MYLNRFAPTTMPLDMTGTPEFESLLASAADLGIATPAKARCVSRNVVANGLRFHLLEWGAPQAPVLLLLHGGNQSSHSWDLVSLALSDRFRVLAVDQRGHGDSEWPRDGEGSPLDMAEDVRAILETEQIAAPIIAGHSMGGLVLMTLLVQHPEAARKAVFVDVGPEPSGEGAQQILDFVRTVREFDSVEEFIARVARPGRAGSAQRGRQTAIYNLMRRHDGKYVSKHDHRRFDQPEFATQLPRPALAVVSRIACPALVVRGERSTVLLLDAAERFVRTLPDARLVTVPAAGHNVHSQNTPGFLEAVEPFLCER